MVQFGSGQAEFHSGGSANFSPDSAMFSCMNSRPTPTIFVERLLKSMQTVWSFMPWAVIQRLIKWHALQTTAKLTSALTV